MRPLAQKPKVQWKDTSPVPSLGETLKLKTLKLIKKLKLKPEQNESVYSQSFIARERDVIKRIR